jgi:hypothetical protein
VQSADSRHSGKTSNFKIFKQTGQNELALKTPYSLPKFII